MPTYEYRCKDCSHDFEIFQAFTDDALTDCPQCDGALKKVYGKVGISFKGSGFYKNDARSGSKSSANGSSSKSESSSDPSSSSSADSLTTSSDKSSEKSSDTSKSTKSSDAAPAKAGAAASSD